MRITDSNMSMLRTRWANDSRANLAEFEQQIGSGVKFSKPSQDPISAATVMRSEGRLNRIDQFARNTANGRLWTSTADQALRSASDNLLRAKTLTIQGGNPAMSPQARSAIAADIRAMGDSLRTVANTKVAGRAIFAGTANVNETYDAAGAYLGDNGVVSRTIDTNETVRISIDGPSVFGLSNPGDPLNGTAFEVMEAIAVAVETGDDAGVRAGLEAIDAVADRVGAATGKIGATSQQLDAADDRRGSEELAVQTNLSKLRDVDIASAVVSLRTAELSYQATMQATSRGLSQSLLNFIR